MKISPKVLLLIMLSLIWFWPWVDYFDWGLWPGINVFHRDKDLEAFVTWFVGFPAAVTVFFSYFVFKTQREELQEARKQTDFELRPFLRLQYNKDRVDKIFTIANDGRGLARDVEFSPFSFKSANFNIVIKSRPVISAGGSSDVSQDELYELSNVWAAGDNRDFALARNMGRKLTDRFRVIARYKDIVNNPYKAVFESDPTYNDGFKIIQQKREY